MVADTNVLPKVKCVGLKDIVCLVHTRQIVVSDVLGLWSPGKATWNTALHKMQS